MAATHIQDNQFDAEVLKSDLPVLVDFYAEWCGPCKMAEPILNKLADEFAGKVKIMKIDVDQSELAGQYGVMSIPTVITFKKQGDEVKEFTRQVGYGGEDKYRELISALIS